MSIVDFIGTLAVISTIPIVFVPMQTLYEGYLKMEVKNLTIEFFLIAIFQSSFWTCFGHKDNDIYVYTLNDGIIIFYIIYLWVFLYINKTTIQIFYYTPAILLELLLVFFLLSARTGLMFASILETLWSFTTIRTIQMALLLKDAEYINLPISWVLMISYILWVIYSYLSSNLLMGIPNFIGAIMWGMNIFIYHWTTGLIADDNFIIKLLKIAYFVEALRESLKNEKLELENGNGNEVKLIELQTASTGRF